MADIAHASVQQNTNQTTTSASYGAVTGASIAAGSFTVDKKYLLWVSAQIRVSTADIVMGMQVVHGSTAFAESELLAAVSNAANIGTTYNWFTVWTAISGEAVTLQFKSNGTDTVNADQIHVLAINLSDDLVENTDWLFAEDGTDALNIGSTAVDGASITFTPGEASDWLVAAWSQLRSDTVNLYSALIRSGEAASSKPESLVEQNIASDIFLCLNPRVFALTAASNTFKEQARSSGATSSADRLHSKIFALNLNKFRNHANAYTDAAVALGTVDYGTLLQTISLTPDIASDVWIVASFNYNKNDTTNEAEFRVQVDEADEPAGQTTDNSQFSQSDENTDEDPLSLSTLVNLSAAAHTIDLDASVDATTGTPTAQYRTLWAVTMELPAAGGGGATMVGFQLRMTKDTLSADPPIVVLTGLPQSI